MKDGFSVEQLDKTTLEFAIEKVWAYRFTCKNTKTGRIQAEAFERVESTLKHFLKEITESEAI